jgi:hypothetical protein
LPPGDHATAGVPIVESEERLAGMEAHLEDLENDDYEAQEEAHM